MSAPSLAGDPVVRRPTAPARLREGLTGPVRGVLKEAGELAQFSGRAVLELRGVFRYSAEILRQVGILVTGSLVVVALMQFVIGMQCATEANYVLRGYGASAYSGVFTAWCGIREMGPYMWGYIIAAKVGCGLVAELGSMRINNEFSAMESLGINPMRYVVATRLMACIIAFPMIYLVGLAFHMVANQVIIVDQIGEVSKGGWEGVHWAFIRPVDVLYSEIKIMAMGMAIVLVAMYYGYTAKGGPVGVGSATARSMILNLVLIHVIGSVLTMVFWGLNPASPVGG
ncbi:ABC transporter permease [Patulibacter minatonensis]|uniref:ABC transporter permease n=1 Tax=Patulibacter minatonensis TaxID=298163 RepID=UPI0004B2C7CA|nr:ABC transporter permease [Patulibacter minatonensis]